MSGYSGQPPYGYNHQGPPHGQPHGQPGQPGQPGPGQQGQQFYPNAGYVQQPYPTPQSYPPPNAPYGYAPNQTGYPAPQGQAPYGYAPQQPQAYGQPIYPPPAPASNWSAPGAPVQQGYPVQQQQPPQGYAQQPQGYAPPPQPYPTQPQGYSSHPPQQMQGSYAQPPLGQIQPLLSAQEVTRDVEILHKAFKGFGCDKETVVSVLGKKTNEQAQQLVQAYKGAYGEDLITRIKKETSGHLEDLLVAICTPTWDLDAKAVYDAIAGLGTDEDLLIEALGGKTNQQINMMKQAYSRIYKRDLEREVAGDLSGDLRKFFVALISGTRDESGTSSTIDMDVQALYNAGEAKWGTEESVFIRILCSRSFGFLAALFKAYEQKYGKPFKKVVESEFSGDMKKVLCGYIDIVMNLPLFLAMRFEKTMYGLGTNDAKLISLTARCRDPALMRQIKAQYQGKTAALTAAKYGKSLVARIKGDTSGHYEKLLIQAVSIGEV
ncbi:hypothetical protein HDU91_000440 [Kappamyces sp. JEL0680]|nr:hypothetical protein HDU91_000440 [Kappamyces sp. JEL0680]